MSEFDEHMLAFYSGEYDHAQGEEEKLDMSDDVSIKDVSCIRETEKAILVLIEGDERWIPKSQITDDSEVYDKEHGDGTLVITKWFADKEGLG